MVRTIDSPCADKKERKREKVESVPMSSIMFLYQTI